MSALRRLALVLVSAGLVGCEGAPANVLDAPPRATLRMCPALPAAMDFGRVPVGGEATRALEGLPDPSVALALSGAGFTLDRSGATPTVTVRPTQPGRLEATLQLSASGCPAQVMSLTADGVTPCVEVASALQLAPAERSCGTAAGTVSVLNRCTTPVTVQRARIEEPADGADVWCAGGPPCEEWGVVSRPDVLAAGASGEVKVRFAPANAGRASATLRLTVQQDDGMLELTSALEGTGLPRQTVTDRFAPPAPPRSDLLVILDNSPSMRERGTSVRAELDALWKYLSLAHRDLQVLVTTAERSASGAIAGTALATDVDFEAKLARVVASLPDGTEDTGCLQPLLAVLEAQPSPLRPGAALKVACITDSPDRAPGSWQDLMARLPANPPLSVAVVGPFVGACVSEWDDGRLAMLASGPYGVGDSICSSGWSQTVQSLWPTSCWGFNTQFYLSQVPLRIVSVEADGVPLEDRSGPAWTWQSATNAVVVEPLYSYFRAELTVTYEPECR